LLIHNIIVLTEEVRDMENKCPLCGTSGRLWNRNPEAFRCPNCLSIFSPFGMVLETETDNVSIWS
jgi:tRNA(Ile2) C34 agmatinyltransferase TiaS